MENLILDKMLAEYSGGVISRKELEEATGLWFGEILTEMAKRNLSLPKVDTRLTYNEKQMALFNKIFAKPLKQIEDTMENQNIRMKHSGSTASDLEIDYTIGDDNTVMVKADHFDSALMQDFIIEILGRRCGVNAIRDDRAEWNPPRPPYRVFILLAGVRYEVEAHYLIMDGFTVVLRPM